MTNKIARALAHPGPALKSALRMAARPIFGRVYAFPAGLRSDSDDGFYAAAIERFLSSGRAYANFKRDPHYNVVLEHVTQEQGRQYLDILKGRDDGLLERALESVLQSDEIGNPRKFHYDDVGRSLSPTTLRYVKVASDLRILFGENLGRMAEIGCGYGGQCLVNDALLSVEAATLYDLPIVNRLIEHYLESFLFSGSYTVSTINRAANGSYDLVISNYAFAELPRQLQLRYVEKVLSRAKRGYLTMNSGRGGLFDENSEKLSLSELQAMLPGAQVFDESPLTYRYNYLLVWGHEAGAAL